MKMPGFTKCFLIAAFVFGSEPAAAGTAAFVYSASNQFGTVDLSTGTYTQIGAPDVLLSSITAMPGQTILALDATSNLRAIDPATARTTLIGGTGFPLFGIEENSTGALYGQTGSSLYSIDRTTGAASLIGDFGPALNFDLAIGTFDSAGNLLEVGTPSGATGTVFFKVNILTGVGALIGPNQALVESILFNGGTLYGFTGVPNSASAGPLVTINVNTGLATVAVLQDPALDIVLGAAIQASSVPEPNAGTLIAFGIIGLGSYCLRRNRQTRSAHS